MSLQSLALGLVTAKLTKYKSETCAIIVQICLEVKREYYQNCSVLGCVTQCSQSAAYLHERSSRLGLSHWDPYAVRRGGWLELYYCNMVEWSWWDSSLI